MRLLYILVHRTADGSEQRRIKKIASYKVEKKAEEDQSPVGCIQEACEFGDLLCRGADARCGGHAHSIGLLLLRYFHHDIMWYQSLCEQGQADKQDYP